MKSLSILKAIALNTFRETVRDRIMYAIFFFALLATLAGLIFGSLSIHQDVRILEDFGLFTITIFGGIIAIFIGTSLVFKEIDKQTIYLVFTKPIARWEFIGGKFLGLSLSIAVISFAMGAFLVLTSYWQTGTLENLGTIFGAVSLVYAELLLVIAFATFFSTFATPLMSMLFTLACWICAHLSESLLALSKISQSIIVKLFCQSVYHLIPNLAALTMVRGEFMNNKTIPYQLVYEILLYILIYIILLLSFATVVAEQREFP